MKISARQDRDISLHRFQTFAGRCVEVTSSLKSMIDVLDIYQSKRDNFSAACILGHLYGQILFGFSGIFVFHFYVHKAGKSMILDREMLRCGSGIPNDCVLSLNATKI